MVIIISGQMKLESRSDRSPLRIILTQRAYHLIWFSPPGKKSFTNPKKYLSTYSYVQLPLHGAHKRSESRNFWLSPFLFPRVRIECYITPYLTKWKSETFRIRQQTNIFYRKFTMVLHYTDNWIITLQAKPQRQWARRKGNISLIRWMLVV